jgi:hypothetical protein
MEGLEAAAKAAANPPDRAEVAKSFGDFISSHLDNDQEN